MRFSVALCTYNGRKYVQEQIDSILAQTILPFEIVISDDKSTDGTLDFLRQTYSSNSQVRFVFLDNKKNVGVIKNFERCLKACSGDFIFLSDQDDIWVPKKIETFASLIERKKYSSESLLMAFSNLQVVDQNLRPLNVSFFGSNLHILAKNELHSFTMTMLQNWIPGCVMMISQGLLNLATPFPQTIPMHDHWMTLLAFAFGKIEYIDQDLVLYRQHAQNVVGAQTLSVDKLKKKAQLFLNGTKAKRMEDKITQAQSVFSRGQEKGLSTVFPQAEHYAKSLSKGTVFEVLSLCRRENLKLPPAPILAYLVGRRFL